MTHPKQLENVARAIYQSNPYKRENIGNGMEGGTFRTIPFDMLASWEVNKFRTMAQAAIEAAFKPLPIEDAPKANIDLFIGNKRYADCTLENSGWYCWAEDCHLSDLTTEAPTGWLPIPTQEGE